MLAFAKEGIPLNLTVSLHASTDEERARTMPVANAYKIADILKACDVYFKETGRRYIFEYSLIGGENSDEKHAHALAALLKGRPCHVNLIRLNEVPPQRGQGALLEDGDGKGRLPLFGDARKGGHFGDSPPQHGQRHRRSLRPTEGELLGKRRE